MPTPAYLTIESANQGLISKGALSEESVGQGSAKLDREDEILVQAFQHEVSIPTDPQTGQPTGLRQHGPLTITKVFDKSSPLLYLALARGETLTRFLLKFQRVDQGGDESDYFSIELEGAIVVKIEAYFPHCQDPSMKHLTHLEKVSFRYRKITWSHIKAATAGSDDWRQKIR